MAYIPAPGVLEVVEFFSTGIANAANVYHVSNTGTWTEALINQVIDEFADWEENEAGDNRASEIAATGFRATDLTSLAGLVVFRAVNIVGNILAPAAPLNATFAVKLVTGLRGRGRQGRVFWFGLSEEQMDAYTMNSIQADGIKANLQDLIARMDAIPGLSLCVLHKVLDGVPLNPRTYSNVIDAAYTDLFVDSQKNRLPGHRRHKRTPSVAP